MKVSRVRLLIKGPHEPAKENSQFDSPMKIPFFRETLHLNSPSMALFLNALQNISLMQLMKRVSGFYYPFITVPLFRPDFDPITHPSIYHFW